jgi:hypothetical protein
MERKLKGDEAARKLKAKKEEEARKSNQQADQLRSTREQPGWDRDFCQQGRQSEQYVHAS